MTEETPNEPDLLEALSGLRRLREPYDGPLRETVHDSLTEYPVLEALPVVEIGAGIGQLRGWLPAPIAAQAVHTDPEPRLLQVLSRASPEARVQRARAQELPFENGACGGVLALCVFDALGNEAEQSAALDEFARILAPGGRFVHFLDMGALLEHAFDEFDEQGLVPIPNVFTDPDEQEWPLDLLLLERDWLEHVLLYAHDVDHPLFTLFGPYFSAFLLKPFSRREAVSRYKLLASDGSAQRALALQAASAFHDSAQAGQPVRPLLPFHSSRHFAQVMEAAFAKDARFEIEFSGMVKRAERRKTASADATRYRSLCVGHERVSERIPPRLLTGENTDRTVQPGSVLVETGVFVFAARRHASG
jgi:SAM-dependent methyltransferase